VLRDAGIYMAYKRKRKIDIIQKNDRAAHGISVLHNVYELRAWVMNTLS